MNITQLIGHFHPLLVHLPIGILVLGLLVVFATQFESWRNLRSILPFLLFWAALSAIISCITGYLLSLNGDYNADLLEKHQWTGIALAVLSTILWASYTFLKQENKAIYAASWISVAVLLTVVGHFGGSLTHGVGYLTEGVFKKEGLKNVKNTEVSRNSREGVMDKKNEVAR